MSQHQSLCLLLTQLSHFQFCTVVLQKGWKHLCTRERLRLILSAKSQGGLIRLFDLTVIIDVFTDFSSEAASGSSRT